MVSTCTNGSDAAQQGMGMDNLSQKMWNPHAFYNIFILRQSPDAAFIQFEGVYMWNVDAAGTLTPGVINYSLRAFDDEKTFWCSWVWARWTTES